MSACKVGMVFGSLPSLPASRSGEQIVSTRCSQCHETGKGAPKDRRPRCMDTADEAGLDAVTRSAVSGHGGIPARGGVVDLTDAELRSANVYMFDTSVGPSKTP